MIRILDWKDINVPSELQSAFRDEPLVLRQQRVFLGWSPRNVNLNLMLVIKKTYSLSLGPVVSMKERQNVSDSKDREVVAHRTCRNMKV
jgi:hypothetical protein